MTQIEAKSWYCEKCPINNDENCGPIEEGTDKIFKSFKQIHEKHPGWQQGIPKKKTDFQDGIDLVVGLLEKNQEEQKAIQSLGYDEYLIQLEEKRRQLEKIIEKDFPNRYFGLEVCLSVKAQLNIENLTQPFALILMGQPSSKKTTILEIVNSLPNCYRSDKFTPKSFVSHSANTKKEDLNKVDLLPKIRHKTLITPELAPLFSGSEDNLVENFGILTRVLDGRGLETDSGVHGKRGYRGDYYFMMMGAVVDIPHRVWKILGNLGPRLYFLRLPEDKLNPIEKKKRIKESFSGIPYIQRVKECQKIIKNYWNYVENRPVDLTESKKIVWNTKQDDDETVNHILEIAMLLSKLRGVIPTWQTRNSDSGGFKYNFEMPIIEDPERASNALYNLARGHAVLYGRNYITKDDLSVVIPVGLSSAQRERVALFKLLIENDGVLNSTDFSENSAVSLETARKEMQKMSVLRLVEKEEEDGDTKPKVVVKLKKEFDWFLSDEFKVYWKAFTALLTPKMFTLSKRENVNKKGVCKEQTRVDNFADE